MTEKDNFQEEENNINKDNEDKDSEKNDNSESTENSANDLNEEKIESEADSESGSEKDKSAGISPSNYQISLINENLLKIKVISPHGIKIDCFAKDKITGEEAQSNQINLHPKKTGESQEIEVIIQIDSKGNIILPEKKKDEFGEPEGNVVFTPVPELADLVKHNERNLMDEDPIIATSEEELQYKIDKGNPFIKFREFYQRNLTIGIIAAVILHLLAVTVYFANAKKRGDVIENEPRRLIVIQDLPEPQINLTEVEDPNAPPPDEIQESDDIPRLTPRNITRSPRVVRPRTSETTPDITKTDTTSIDEINRELDSLRNLTGVDTSSTGNVTNYVIPDSLRNTFNQSEVGLELYFPSNWKLIDSRDVNNKEEFEGIFLSDTTAQEKGDMTLFISLDPTSSDYKKDHFVKLFAMDDTSLIAYYREPEIVGAVMRYDFYIFGSQKLFIQADIRKQHFENYRKEIEAVVRSIKIRQPTSLN